MQPEQYYSITETPKRGCQGTGLLCTPYHTLYVRCLPCLLLTAEDADVRVDAEVWA